MADSTLQGTMTSSSEKKKTFDPKRRKLMMDMLASGEDPNFVRHNHVRHGYDREEAESAINDYYESMGKPSPLGSSTTNQNVETVGGRQFEIKTPADYKAVQEIKQSELTQKRTSESAKRDFQEKIKKLDELLGNKEKGIERDTEGLEHAVGPNPLARMPSPFTGDKQRFTGKLESILSTETLDSLINAKAEGATFGALSDAELNLLRASASTLGQWAKKDKDGKIVSFDASEEDVVKELQNFQTLTRQAYDRILEEDQMMSGGQVDNTQQGQQPSLDDQAYQWLQSNPDDPRAERIRTKLESKGYFKSNEENSEFDARNKTKEELENEDGIKAFGFFDDVKNSFSERTENNAEILNSEDATASKVLQTTGQNLGFFSDVVGSAVVNTLKAVTPDFIEKPATEKIKELVSAGLESEVAQKTVASWEDFKQSNPEMARNIEAGGNIANFFALGLGSGTGAKLGANALGETASKVGTVLEKSGDASAQVAKTKFAQELVMPIQDKATKIAQVGRTKEEGKGFFKRNVVTPTAAEKRAADEVMQVEGVSPDNTLQQNYNAIQEAVSKQADDLITSIGANDFAISKDEVLTRLNDVTKKLKESPLIVGEAESMANRLLNGAKRFINENDETGSGLLKARKAYDAWVLKQKPKAFDAKAENAFTVANREVRTAINSLLDEKAPDLGVKESLRKQSTLLNAMDNIAPKAAKEADTALGRAANKMYSMVNVNSELSKKVVGTGAALGVLGGLTISPTLVGAAVGVGATAKLVKALGNPKLRQQFGKILKAVGGKLNPEEKTLLEDLLNQTKGKGGMSIQDVSKDPTKKIQYFNNGKWQTLDEIAKEIVQVRTEGTKAARIVGEERISKSEALDMARKKVKSLEGRVAGLS